MIKTIASAALLLASAHAFGDTGENPYAIYGPDENDYVPMEFIMFDAADTTCSGDTTTVLPEGCVYFGEDVGYVQLLSGNNDNYIYDLFCADDACEDCDWSWIQDFTTYFGDLTGTPAVQGECFCDEAGCYTFY